MSEQEMDNMIDGECKVIMGGVLTKIAPGTFQFSDTNGYSNMGSTSSICQMINTSHAKGVAINPFSGGLSAAMGVAYPSPKPLTTEERKRLTDLEVQVKAHCKFEQLKKFKAMPRHIRQEIVDEAYVRDLTGDLNQNHEGSFQFSKELKDLRDKNNGYPGHYGAISAGHLSSMFHQELPHMGGRFSTILSKFSTEELARAHAEICLEEDIAAD